MSLMAAATIGSALIGARAAKSAAKQAGTTTTKTAAPEYIAPQYETLASDIYRLRDAGLLGDVQTYSPYERRLIESGMAQAATGSPFQAASERAVSDILRGGGMFGEAADIYRDISAAPSGLGTADFEKSTQQAVERALRPITSQYARGGRLGSGLFGEAVGEAAAQTVSDAMSQAAQQQIQNRMAAASGLAGLGEAGTRSLVSGIEAGRAVSADPFTNIGRGLQFGGLLSGQEFALRQAPVTAAQRYSDLLRGATVGQQTTQPLYAPSSGAGALLGASLIQSAPQIGQAFGSMFAPKVTVPSSVPMNLGGGQTYQQTSTGRFVNPTFANIPFGQ